MKAEIEAIVKEVEKFNESIKDALDSKNISDTGEAADSLYVKHGIDFVQSIGIFYLEFLDTGRGPGKFPPKEPIEDWVQGKLGKSPSDSDFDGIVFVIQRKIAEIGTSIFLNNNEGVELDKKIAKLRENINEAVAESVKLQVLKKLDRFKKVATKQKYEI
jgi:hypothetical protein